MSLLVRGGICDDGWDEEYVHSVYDVFLLYERTNSGTVQIDILNFKPVALQEASLVRTTLQLTNISTQMSYTKADFLQTRFLLSV